MLSANACFGLVLIGRNIALFVLLKFTAARKLPANGGAGHQAWTIRILKALKIKEFQAVVNRGADTFLVQPPKRPSNGLQKRFYEGDHPWLKTGDFIISN